MKSSLNIYDQKGVSLLEIMVAILILTTGFIGVASLQSRALHGIYWAQHRSTAILLAQSQLESIPFDDLDNHHGSSKQQEFDMDNTKYFVSINVDPLGTATQKTVEVSVSWLNKSIRIETIRFP
jgi:prepilin-type N-terminal cleavage/methylation domain-containing protein